MTQPIFTELSGKTLLVRLSGPLDSTTSVEVRTTVEKALADGAKAVIMNLRDVQGLDSTGIGALITLRRRISPPEHFRLCELPDRIDKIIRMSQLDGIFSIDSLEESSRAEIGRGPAAKS